MSISLTYTERGEVVEQSTAPSSTAELGGGSQSPWEKTAIMSRGLRDEQELGKESREGTGIEEDSGAMGPQQGESAVRGHLPITAVPQ